MRIPKAELETIIRYDEAEPTASVYTTNAKLLAQLNAMALEFPDVVKLESINPDGIAREYTLPKKLIAIRKPVRMTAEQRAALAERARQNLHR